MPISPLEILYESAVPVAGTDEVQSITSSGTPTGGTFRLEFGGFITATITHTATAAAVATALNALPSIGASGVAGGGGPLGTAAVTITFSGNNMAKKNQPLITLAVNSLTGGTAPTMAIATTTPGVDATGRGAPPGTLLVVASGAASTVYQNRAAAGAPAAWTLV
jgi:hypothetical protein